VLDDGVVVWVELLGAYPAAGQDIALATRDEMEQDPPSRRPFPCRQRLEHGVSVATDRAMHAADSLVRGERERSLIALLPQVD
jgi:hypothetical protein